MADHIDGTLAAHKIRPLSLEGLSTSQWVVMDFADVIVHIFRTDLRKHYALEKLWGDAKRLRIPAERVPLVSEPIPTTKSGLCAGPSRVRNAATAAEFISRHRREPGVRLCPRIEPGHRDPATRPNRSFRSQSGVVDPSSMALGALIVILTVGVRETRHLILTWRTSRLTRRKEKVDALHREGAHAVVSKRTTEAIGLFQRALTLDPNHGTRCCGSAISIAQSRTCPKPSASIERRAASTNITSTSFLRSREIWKRRSDLKKPCNAPRNPAFDAANLTALIRKRELYIRLEQWLEAMEIQHRILKSRLPEQDQVTEAGVLVGLTYEVGRQLLSGASGKSPSLFPQRHEARQSLLAGLYRAQ